MKLTIREKRSNPVAMISGVGGQDGSYLAELLLQKGYTVIGICRRSSVDNTERIKHLKPFPQFKLIDGDVTDACNVNHWFTNYKPDEFYNLAAQSHVGTSFEQPLLTFRVNAEGVLNILEAARRHSPKTRLYQASTSEMFGRNYQQRNEWHDNGPPKDGIQSMTEYMGCKYQDEDTKLSPQSPYAVAKIAAHDAFGLYRRAYNLHASCGILFNHESERRGEQFVTRKITKWIGEFEVWVSNNGNFFENGDDLVSESARHTPQNFIDRKTNISLFEDNVKFPKLRLGNLDAFRDWGHAEDYVEAMWRMLQQDKPDDYVIATGKAHSVEEFLDAAFREIGRDDWKQFVVQDPDFMRPAEIEWLCGNATKAKKVLNWEPRITFSELVSRMVQNDISIAATNSKALLC